MPLWLRGFLACDRGLRDISGSNLIDWRPGRKLKGVQPYLYAPNPVPKTEVDMHSYLKNVAKYSFMLAFVVSCKSRSPDSTVASSTAMPPRFVSGYVAPPIQFDAGAGPYNSVVTTPAAIVKRDAARVFCSTVAPSLYGREAAYIFNHYLGNTGKDISVAIEPAITDSTVMKVIYNKELRAALEYSNQLPAGDYKFSSRSPIGSKVTRNDSLNWYLALGGFQVWSQSVLKVTHQGQYSLAFDFFLQDRYNWDSGHTFNLGSISVTSDELGLFHRMGISKEFTTSGVARKVYTWKSGDDVALLPSLTWPALKLNEKDLKIRQEQKIEDSFM